MTDVPHFTLPFAWTRNGHAGENEQDSQPDVAVCVAALLLCPLGWRAEAPDYGVAELTFQLVLDHEDVASAIERWEPRAVFDLNEEAPDETDLLTRHVNVLLGVMGA